MARKTEKLNVKECADMLYAMATLNFPDDLLLEKTCDDLRECVASNQKPAVIGSILTSLGLLRYKNTGKCCSVFSSHSSGCEGFVCSVAIAVAMKGLCVQFP
jgi:hypothetical protein